VKKILPHIRLVVSEAAVPSEAPNRVTVVKRRTRQGEQLKLDLTGCHEEKQVFLVAMGTVHGSRFMELIHSIKPKIVVDTRYSIRFDLPGTSRDHVFAKFSNLQAFYSKASIPWHQLSASDFMVDKGPISIRLHHEILERAEDRIMVLIPDTQHLRLLRSYLNREVSKSSEVNWRIEEAS